MTLGTTAAVGWGSWAFDPPLVLTIDLAFLYWLGSRRTVTPVRRQREQRRCDLCFYLAMVTLVIALASPIELLSEDLFWVHMVQHVLLMLVAAPLFVLARPWTRLWRALPLRGRRQLARWMLHASSAAPLRAATRALGQPPVSLAVFTVVLLGWHVPSLFDATLRSSALHGLEHTLFFLSAVLLFKQLIPSPPLRTPLSDGARAAYAIAAMTVSWALAVVLALAPSPLYGHYAALSSRPGGISALADQQLAAGVMWVPGSITFMLIVFVQVHRWLNGGTPLGRPGLAAGGGER